MYNETMSYDLDGNRTGDAKWSYTWKNGRCERVTWATTPTPGTAGPVDNHYVYDENGRVISRTAAGGQVDLYFWQGHLRMAERAQTGLYPGMIYLLWGTDASGSLDGAGGVGGLRASYATGYYSQYPVYRGNHNIEDWYNKVGGLAAEIKYNAYGLIVAKTGQPFANFGFQTQYTDLSTGLICYEQRWYDPRTQTWVSLDPIEEQGGVNLYQYCAGNTLRSYDNLGYSGTSWFNANNNGAILAYWLYLTGIKSEIIMGPNSDWTKLMQVHLGMQQIRNRIKEDLLQGEQRNSAEFSLNKAGKNQTERVLFNLKWMANDVIGMATFGYLGHERAYLTGSFWGDWYVNSMQHCNSANIRITLHDSLRFHSNFRLPFTNIGPANNPFGTGLIRPFQNLDLTWWWDEDINY